MAEFRIFVDAKQPDSFVRMLQNAYPDAMVLNLGAHSGDILIQFADKTVLIEVKELNDFVASIVDRRLFRQALGMREITPWSFLLVGGDFKYNGDNKLMLRGPDGYGPTTWTRDHIDGALTRIQASGVIVRFAYKGYIEALRLIISWVEHADQGSVTREVIKLSPLDEADQAAVNLLTLFDGIGLVQAKSFIAWAGKRPLYEYLEKITKNFDGKEKPDGWTNNTIERIRRQLGLNPKATLRAFEVPEWTEELDE